MAGVGEKRARIFVDGDRPRKMCHLEGGVHVSTDPPAADVVMMEAPDVVIANGWAAPLGLVTVAGYIGTGSVFDWASMNEALLVDGYNPHVHVPDPFHLAAVGGLSEVSISKKMILREIGTKMNLRLYEWKVVVQPSGLYRAWIEMNVSSDVLDGPNMRKRFYGDDLDSKNASLESAAEAAIDYLVLQCHVIVKDVNYEKADALEKKCACAEDYNGMFLDLIKTKEKQLEDVYEGLSGFVAAARHLCSEFSDVIPIEVQVMDGPTGSAATARVVYIGSMPPLSPLEKVASIVVGLVDEAFNIARKRVN